MVTASPTCTLSSILRQVFRYCPGVVMVAVSDRFSTEVVIFTSVRVFTL